MAGENLDPVLQAQLRETYGISPPDTVGQPTLALSRGLRDGRGSVDNPLTPMGPGQVSSGENDPNSFLGRILYNADKTAGKAIADSNPPQLPLQGSRLGSKRSRRRGDRQGAAGAAPWRCRVSGGGAPSPTPACPPTTGPVRRTSLESSRTPPATAPHAPTRRTCSSNARTSQS